MPVSTLVTTAGSPVANSYVELTVAEQYHLDRSAAGTTWVDASEDDKNAAILWATKLLDANFVWFEYVTFPTQFLAWPRIGLLDRHKWSSLDPYTIPIEIQWATAEYARQLIASDLTSDSDVEVQGITAIKAGSLELKFRDYGIRSKEVPDVVARLIPPHWGYLRNTFNYELERA